MTSVVMTINFQKKPVFVVLLIILASMSIVFFSQCNFNEKKQDTSEELPPLAYLNHHDSVQYVGSVACQPCHLDKFNSFLETGMGSSFGLADSVKSAAYHVPSARVYDTLLDLYYQSKWHNGKLFIEEFRLFNGDTVHFRSEEVSYVIGSGQHTNSHLLERNGYVYQAPLTFYTQDKVWDLPPGFRTANARFSRRIEMECMSCHNALPKHDAAASHKYLSIPKGIDCERCHGPGELHVQYRLSSPQAGEKEGDPTIVNPSKLPWDLQVDVCQRCHLQGNAVLKEGKAFQDFRPGMKLVDVFTVFMPQYKEGSTFKMAAHAERLQQSQCFIQTNKNEKTDKKLTCITCHNPHVSVKHTGKEIFSAACKNCHTAPSLTCNVSAHAVSKEKDNCVGCHMPATGSADIPHVTVHDHYIRKDYSDLQKTPSGLVGLKAINSKKSDTFTLFAAYVSYYEKFERNSFYLQKAAALLPYLGKTPYALSLKIYYYYTVSDYASIRKLVQAEAFQKPSDAWTAYRIAMSYKESLEWGKAIEWIDKALITQARNLPFLVAKASLCIDAEKYAQATQLLQEIKQLDPKEELAYSEEARLFLRMQKIKEANVAARKALQLDPNNLVALKVLVQIAELTGYKPTHYEYWQEKLKLLQ
jgi:hypothetical protein